MAGPTVERRSDEICGRVIEKRSLDRVYDWVHEGIEVCAVLK